MYRITPVLSGEWLRDSDLMVGDLLKYTNEDEHYVDAVARVLIVGANHITALVDGNAVFAHTSHFRPIALTEEILSANGWHIGRVFPLKSTPSTYIELDIERKQLFVHDRMSGESIVTSMPIPGFNVHSLQHALKISGLSSEADGFVVV